MMITPVLNINITYRHASNSSSVNKRLSEKAKKKRKSDKFLMVILCDEPPSPPSFALTQSENDITSRTIADKDLRENILSSCVSKPRLVVNPQAKGLKFVTNYLSSGIPAVHMGTVINRLQPFFLQVGGNTKH